MARQTSLDDLLIDEEEFNESILTDVLAPYVRIGNNSGALVPTDDFESLSATAQTAVVLLYRKATYELGLSEDEGITPKGIAEISGINHSTVKTAVRELSEGGLAVNDGGKYSIPTYNYDSVRELIEDGENDG